MVGKMPNLIASGKLENDQKDSCPSKLCGLIQSFSVFEVSEFFPLHLIFSRYWTEYAQ
jgi:hypothetical protein